MLYESFKRKVLGYMEKAGISKTVFFDHDTDKRQYTAWVPGEELRFTCSESGLNMAVKFRRHTYPIPT